MTLIFRVILIAVSIITMIFMMRRIRQARVQIEAVLFWVVTALILVLFSVFPPLADMCARILGIYSTPNFLFLFMIFLLMVKLFGMTLQLSRLESRLQELVQKLAIEAYEREAEEGRRAGIKAEEISGQKDYRTGDEQKDED